MNDKTYFIIRCFLTQTVPDVYPTQTVLDVYLTQTVPDVYLTQTVPDVYLTKTVPDVYLTQTVLDVVVVFFLQHFNKIGQIINFTDLQLKSQFFYFTVFFAFVIESLN